MMIEGSDKRRSNNKKLKNKSVPNTHGDSGAIEMGYQTSDQKDTEKQNTIHHKDLIMLDIHNSAKVTTGRDRW